MKKLLVRTAAVGVVVGVCYLLFKIKKEDNKSAKSIKEKTDFELKVKDEATVEEYDVVQEMYVAKEKSAQSISERHTEGARIITDTFANIMKDIDMVESDTESVEAVVDIKNIEIINELDSLSNELDKFIK